MKDILEFDGLIQNILKIFRITIGHTLRANIGHEHEDAWNLRIQISEKIWNVLYSSMSKS